MKQRVKGGRILGRVQLLKGKAKEQESFRLAEAVAPAVSRSCGWQPQAPQHEGVTVSFAGPRSSLVWAVLASSISPIF